jgi:hypothetical protein
MKITVDLDLNDGYIIIVPHEYLDPQQIREMQNVFQQRQAIILPEGRIIEETFPVR